MVLKRLMPIYNFEVQIITLNASNKASLYEKYNLDNSKIPSIFIEDKMISSGMVKEREIKEALDKYI